MKEISGKCNMIIVPVPKNADEFHIIHDSTRFAYFLPDYHRIDIPKNRYEIISKFSTLTEEQAKELVDTIHVEIAPSPSNDWGGSYDYAYVDYQNQGEYAGWNGDAGCFIGAIDSLKSLFRVNECYIKDPRLKPEMNFWCASSIDYDQFTKDLEEYNNTPEDYVILKIIE